MAIDITIPSVGESITEATVARWLKKEGELVEQGEPLVELETEKATTELPAPAAGMLRIRVKEGETVDVGAAIGSIEEAAEKPEAEAKRKPAPPSPPKKTEEEKPKEEKPRAEGKPARQPAAPSPATRRLAREERIEPPPTPSRPQVRAEVKAEARAVEGDHERREPMTPIRQRIAQRLLASQQSTATLTTFNEADLSAIQEVRARHKQSFREQHGVDLGLMPFFVKASVLALQAYPIVNARMDKGDIVYHDTCNIAVAVSTEKGLMAPVLQGAEHMNFVQIEKTLDELAEKARAGKISIQDLQGGTFTITNGGVFGSLLSTPILNPPQSAILGMHVIQKRPVVVDDQIVIRPMMYLALSYDHRLIDGQDAVRFLVHVKDSVENPIRMLFGV